MNLITKMPDNAKIEDYFVMDRYYNELPALTNMYYQTNLLTIIDKLPKQALKREPEALQINLNLNKDQAKSSVQALQGTLENVKLAERHQCDGLGNDTQINQYSIMKALLGKGSHSFVKLAKHNGKSYAIKIISLDRIKKKYYMKDQHIVKMINSEINLLISLKSPYIIGFEQAIYSPEKERIFIVLEYCSKGSLLKVIANSESIPVKQWRKLCKKYLTEMVRGLKKLHDSNVIHRDMKAENVLISDANEVKIIDFNVSIEIPPDGKITVTDKFVGTKTYAPPQLVIPQNKSRVVDGRLVDVWALGITFLELLERRHPFPCNSVEQLIKYLQKPIQLNRSYEPELADLLKAMLHFENSERIQLRQILEHPWLKS